MTTTIARLILAMLILPSTGAVFVILVAAILQPGAPPSAPRLLLLWSVVYVFVGTYWVVLWHGVVHWTERRVLLTAGGTVAALMCGVAVGVLCVALNPGLPAPIGVLFGGAAVPIVWVLLTVVAWRETHEERARRLGAAGADRVVCPVCGYAMTGLREARCPECGASFTLEQLFAAQPAREAASAGV